MEETLQRGTATGVVAAGTTLAQLLRSAESQAGDLGVAYSQHAAALASLRDRLIERQFHLAVLGQFKRGKSTLLNALVGAPLLPTAVVPLTATPVYIRFGAGFGAQVAFEDGREDGIESGDGAEPVAELLGRYATELGNPGNRLGVTRVDVQCPSALLADGLVLIDTPGIGSTLRHNTEATLSFLPQCDAALFVVSADPPLTETEVEFLSQVQAHVPRLFFVLNKADYLSKEERCQAVAFLRRVLVEQAGLPGDTRIFILSARQGLEARSCGDETLWSQSGMAVLQRYLEAFLVNDSARALQDAVARKAAAAIASLVDQLQLTIRSLTMPVGELEKRAEALARSTDLARTQLVTAQDLLQGDQARSRGYLEAQAQSLREDAMTHFSGIVQEAIAQEQEAVSEASVRETLASAIPPFFEQRLRRMSELLSTRVTDTLKPHQERADALIESVRATAAELFDIPYRAPESSEAFDVSHEPFWVLHKWDAHVSPIPPELVDRFLPLRTRQARIARRLMAQVESLVRHNVENLRWAALQNLNSAFRLFGEQLAAGLQDTIVATQGAVVAAQARRVDQAGEVAAEVRRLSAVARELGALHQRLSAYRVGSQQLQADGQDWGNT